MIRPKCCRRSKSVWIFNSLQASCEDCGLCICVHLLTCLQIVRRDPCDQMTSGVSMISRYHLIINSKSYSFSTISSARIILSDNMVLGDQLYLVLLIRLSRVSLGSHLVLDLDSPRTVHHLSLILPQNRGRADNAWSSMEWKKRCVQ